jgi:cytochrome P450
MSEQTQVIADVVADEVFGFNPFDPVFRANPYPAYARLREEEPFHQSPFGVLVLSRYADCLFMLQHPNVSSDERNSIAYKLFMQAQGMSGEDRFVERRPFLFMDPPDHTRLRGLVTKAFTPRVIDKLRPRIQEVVDAAIDAAVEKGSMDVINDLAYPLPVTVISEMLGVPAADHETFKEWSRELARSLDPDLVLPPEVIARRQQAAEEFAEYFRGLIAARRREPQDDLLSALIAAEQDGAVMSEEELLSTCILILIAGHETTVNLIGNGVLAFMRNRDAFERFKADPAGLARTAVEEVLRYDPPVQMTGRIALEDIEVGGHKISKGEQSVLLIGSANRDPGQFSEPNTFDAGRAKNNHLSFSSGIHFCLGAPLARLEGQIALRTMAERLPQMELAAGELGYKENIVLRGLAALPVSLR